MMSAAVWSTQAATENSVLKRPERVLVAEDEHLLATDLAKNLREQGYKVIGPVPDGQAAIDLAKTSRPDLALLDIRMPKLDGLAAAGTIFGELGIPAVILSAFSDEEYLRLAQNVGVFGYLVKPVTPQQLRACIDVAWSRFQHSMELREETDGLKRKLEERRVVERAKWILVQRKGMTEAEAMHTLQKHARSTRRKMVDVAQQLLDANELI